MCGSENGQTLMRKRKLLSRPASTMLQSRILQAFQDALQEVCAAGQCLWRAINLPPSYHLKAKARSMTGTMPQYMLVLVLFLLPASFAANGCCFTDRLLHLEEYTPDSWSLSCVPSSAFLTQLLSAKS